ncbi:hypothetical protein QWY82_08245 [Simiduia curdlanivorans]|uniref:DUF6795 domain-containing protein n=1 Tax=Simiduia curdlanivorans TaxID=1492769 RepID=A0ABV8V6D9_9GAMM|nr:DUF6795 domain-containing protein [Simiduia curdlanivorans]MDN3638795.1 hypothetical protein [Simiduia curdlanivorans]
MKSIRNIYLITLIAFSSLACSQSGAPMSILDAGKAYFFSPVSMQIYRDGQPVVGANVVRRWEHSTIEQDESTTDAEGKVNFPEVRRRTIVQVIPAEFVVAQQIIVVVEGEEIEVWSNSKRDSAINSELGGKPLNFRCELNDEEQLHRDFGSAFFTKCTWE